MALDHKHRQPETLTNKNQNDCDKKPISKSGEDQSIRYGATDEGCLPSSPIPVSSPVLPHYGSLGRDFYYRSARSLSRSHTPTARSYLERTPPVIIQDGRSMREPLLSGIVSPQSAPHSNAKNLLSVVSMPIFFLAIFGLHLSLHRSASASSIKLARGVVIPTGRKLLQNGGGPSVGGGGSSGIGTYLGWAMAAIYMGGRLPQICLNANLIQKQIFNILSRLKSTNHPWKTR
ncbi:hypothetical protein QJS10_CPB17g01622 [Acorus calamus]|uniref:Uncharacterized protein n=1 Tax=Acorus calamus TaxID=4465 RepID=A0AAV9CUF1_ACOCL|nr:hypothetical protein QJS10_CPB17g01622 [Acorus calamus]